jgi:hypothetical protein
VTNPFDEETDPGKDAVDLEGEFDAAKRSGGDVELKASGGDVESAPTEGTDSGGDVESEPTGDQS